MNYEITPSTKPISNHKFGDSYYKLCIDIPEWIIKQGIKAALAQPVNNMCQMLW